MLNNQLNKSKSILNINKLYIFTFFHSLIFAYVIERLFGLERGLNIQEMVYIEILYAFVVLVFEVPTGIFADKYGYKISIVISSVLYFFEMIILSNAYNFYTFSIATTLVAIAGALASGSMNALLYNSLKSENLENDFEKIIGRQNIFGVISASIAGLTGSYIADKYGFTMNYYLSIISYFICLIVSFSLVEPKINDNEFKDEEDEKFDFKNIISFFNENSEVKLLGFYNIIFGALIVYIEEYYQIYLKEINFPVYLFGFVLLIIFICDGISHLYSYKFKKLANNKYLFIINMFISSLCLISTNYIKNYYSILSLAFVFFLYGITEPLIMGTLHHRIKTDRATIESFISFGLRFFTIIIGLLFGYISTNLSIFNGFMFLGLIMLFYTLCLVYKSES
ncbi:MAG: MFS transporter [Candidatus Sericytochromatia bacterium]